MKFRQHSDMTLRQGWFLPVIALSALVYGSTARADASEPGAATISPADLQDWQETSFVGHTIYRVEEGDNGPALHATADGSASGLCRTVQIDLESTPVLRWYWRLDRAPLRTDERGKEGDDQGLRLSFLYQSGTMEEPILAVQYVWSQNEPVDASWTNAFVPSAHEFVARSGPARPGIWEAEQRDLQADFRAAFGREIARVDAVCLMTDGDQTGALVEGWYGDITLQAR